MTPNDNLHLAADVRDLQIVDVNHEYCGIVDDIELEGEAGGRLAVAAILVGPGAWQGRLSRPVLWLAQRIAGKHVVRVPWSEVKHITSVVTLARPAKELGLTRGEEQAAKRLPRIGGRSAAV